MLDILQQSDLTIEDLLPHRPPMLLVENVLEVDSSHAVTLSTIKKSWPMAESNGVHPLILIELSAQTAGVCNGWDRVQTLGKESEKMGWLVGVKKAVFSIDSLPYSESIKSRATNTHSFDKLREVECEQHIGNTLIGKITLQLFQA